MKKVYCVTGIVIVAMVLLMAGAVVFTTLLSIITLPVYTYLITAL